MKFAHFLFAACLVIGFAKQAESTQQFYFECNDCTDVQMQSKATSTWFGGYRADAHVFNEKDKIYKKYRLIKQTMGQGEEIWTNVVALPRTPNQHVLTAFNNLVDSKRVVAQAASQIIVVIRPDGNYDIEDRDVYYSEKKSRGKQTQSVSPTQDVGGALPDSCIAPAYAGSNLTAISFLESATGRAKLFEEINKTFEARSIGNWPKLLDDSKEFAEALEVLQIPVVSQAGSLLRIFAKTTSSGLVVATPDGGRMKVSLDFASETATIELALDGNCNEIPLSVPETHKIYEFTLNNNVNRLENWLQNMGMRISGSYGTRGLICKVRTLSCSTPYNGQRTCTRECAQWVTIPN
ncbi:MAG: hypothetical protein WA981_15475 [Glaciecola sp.]